ncbi:TPA: hypothetical protein OT788_001890 [Escherichia coli]|nr:hypothetical protein [Escherichia coli]HBE3988687.1 hypothetical protein [Escherichia coli]HBP8876037.1 hypothetical protein [Escherichia coli]HCT7372148.1 hypothetical protein [Escherichia coli]HEC3660130.1 hypothetical protein [Escherichia coli]
MIIKTLKMSARKR